MPLVYVYGTLRPGKEETVDVPGELFDLGWYPGARLLDPATATSFIKCEPVEVTEEKLRDLDYYEGYNPIDHSGLFLRQSFRNGVIYTYNGYFDGKFRIPSGDWLDYIGEKEGRNAHLVARG